MFILRKMLPLLLLGCFLFLAVGCTDHEQLKQDLLQAASKQEQVQSFRFSGEANLQLDAALFQGAQPMTAAMLGLFKESTIQYEGMISLTERARMEATFTMTPKGAASPIVLPVLLKDNKMYLHLPAINQTDEYMMFPIENIQGKSNPTSGSAFGINVKLLEGIDSKWLEPGSKDELQSNGEPAKRITLTVNEKNLTEVSKQLSTVLPSILNDLTAGGLSSADQTERFKSFAEQWSIAAPSSISTTIDEQGFIREQSGKLSFTAKNSGKTVSVIEWTQKIDDVNQPPNFTKEVPKQVKNLQDILRLLPTAPKS